MASVQEEKGFWSFLAPSKPTPWGLRGVVGASAEGGYRLIRYLKTGGNEGMRYLYTPLKGISRVQSLSFPTKNQGDDPLRV